MQRIIKRIPKNIYLLISILLFAFVIPIIHLSHIKLLLFEASYTVMLLSIFSIIDKRSAFLKYLIPISIFIIWMTNFTQNESVKYLSFIFSVIVLISTTLVMVSQIVHSKTVTAKVIIETICGYLLIGIILFFLNSIVLWYNPNAISIGQTTTGSHITELIYFSFVTVTTIGYGEIIPISPTARSLSVLFAVISQLYLAFIIAFILGKFINKKTAKEDSVN